MNEVSDTTYALGYGGAALFVLGTAAAILLLTATPNAALRRKWNDYVALLDKDCRFLLLEHTGQKIARFQAVAMLAAPVIAFVLGDPITLVGLWLAIAFGPYVSLRSKSRARVVEIEAQLDAWLLMLSNALKATPSLGEAASNSARLMRPPISEELDLALKENKLGTPLDQAILNMSSRIGSQSVSSALATILVGRQTGGDLPKILEESAATLREMARLEGVVRTKTAEGKTQAYVLGCIPFVLIGAIHAIDEHWLEPLGNSTMGYLIIVVAAVFWLSAIFLARRILSVDV